MNQISFLTFEYYMYYKWKAKLPQITRRSVAVIFSFEIVWRRWKPPKNPFCAGPNDDFNTIVILNRAPAPTVCLIPTLFCLREPCASREGWFWQNCWSVGNFSDKNHPQDFHGRSLLKVGVHGSWKSWRSGRLSTKALDAPALDWSTIPAKVLCLTKNIMPNIYDVIWLEEVQIIIWPPQRWERR